MKVLRAVALSSLLSTTTVAHGYRGAYEPPPAFSDKGRVYIGGSFTFVSSSGTVDLDGDEAELPDSALFGGAFNLGYFVTGGLMLGVTAAFETRSQELDGDETSTTAGVLEVFPRYYIPLGASKEAFLFLLGSLGFQSVSSSEKFDGDRSEASASGFTFSVGAGLAAVVGGPERGAVVDMSLRLRKSFLTHEDDFGSDFEVSSDRTDVGFAVGIGVFF